MTYGLNYKGSKNSIAEWVVQRLPQRDHFYDLFCGGCAVTHCALLGRKYKSYHINDIDALLPQLFVDAIRGKYLNERRWISREDFHRLKMTDAYVASCWSFGGNCKNYLYGSAIEGKKKALHYALFNNDDSLLKDLGVIVPSDLLHIGVGAVKYRLLRGLIKKQLLERVDLQSYEGLTQLESFGRLLRLLQLYDLIDSALTISAGDYSQVSIAGNSVIYCDIPYINTDGYRSSFDWDRFYAWCAKQTELVVVSEYSMPEDRFICVAARSKTCIYNSSSRVKTVERLFIPRHQEELYKSRL